MCCQLHHSPVFLERREYIPFAASRQAKSVKILQKGEKLSLFLHPDEQEGDICRGDAGYAGSLADGARAHAGQSPPTHALQDKVTIPVSVPFGVDAEGNPRPILARISATFRVEDWGFVTVDGKSILDMTRSRETPGIYGGHPTWPAETASEVVASGEHVLEFHYENIEMADASNNKLVCEYSYRVVALEDGGVKDEEPCGCGGSSCSMDGGVPGARSGAAAAGSSSAGSEISATVTEDSLFWSCNVGTLRDNGRASSRALNCDGSPIWEVDEDGIRTDYFYDSTRRLKEVSRQEICDGETVITPETITEYVRDPLQRRRAAAHQHAEAACLAAEPHAGK